MTSRPEQIQRAVIQHLRARSAPNVFAFHPANGGYRQPTEAKILQGLGVTSGVPDIIAVGWPLLRARIEGRGGKLTEAQRQVLIKLRSQRHGDARAQARSNARVLEGLGALTGAIVMTPDLFGATPEPAATAAVGMTVKLDRDIDRAAAMP